MSENNELDTIAIETRLIGKEDVSWDENGNGAQEEQETFLDQYGVEHPVTKINASHVPLPAALRGELGGADNVASGLKQLHDSLPDTSQSVVMDDDVTISLVETMTATDVNSLLALQKKNLGGHTLTIVFAEALDLSWSEPVVVEGFYNGAIVFDLNGITIYDLAALDAIFLLRNCCCSITIENGSIGHTRSPLGVAAEYCLYVNLSGLAFAGTGQENSYAVGCHASDGYMNSCTFASDKKILYTGFIADGFEEKGALATHNASSSAHAALFALKANLASPTFTGTPKAPTAAAGTNSTQVATTAFVKAATDAHNASTSAHSGGFEHDVKISKSNPSVILSKTGSNYDIHLRYADTHFYLLVASAGTTNWVTSDGFTIDVATGRVKMVSATLASPVITGTATAPTPSAGDSSTKIATTAFVAGNFAKLSGNNTFSGDNTFSGNHTLTGALIRKRGTIDLTHLPGSNIEERLLVWQDKNATSIGRIRAVQTSTGKLIVGFCLNQGVLGNNNEGHLWLAVEPDGTITTAAPTPVSTDNSNKIATTEFVTTANAARPNYPNYNGGTDYTASYVAGTGWTAPNDGWCFLRSANDVGSNNASIYVGNAFVCGSMQGNTKHVFVPVKKGDKIVSRDSSGTLNTAAARNPTMIKFYPNR